MAEKRSDKSCFLSNYDGGFISSAQYITECLCVLIAKQKRVELRDKFWNEPYWSKLFRSQIPTANKLLKSHPPEVILAALRDKRCKKIQSLRANWLLQPILKEKQKEYDVKEAQSTGTNIRKKTSTTDKPAKRTGGKNKSLFSKLKENDG
jgi:hypothetical protein